MSVRVCVSKIMRHQICHLYDQIIELTNSPSDTQDGSPISFQWISHWQNGVARSADNIFFNIFFTSFTCTALIAFCHSTVQLYG